MGKGGGRGGNEGKVMRGGGLGSDGDKLGTIGRRLKLCNYESLSLLVYVCPGNLSALMLTRL